MPDGSAITKIPDQGIDADTLRQVSVYSRGTYLFGGRRVTLHGLAPGAAPRMAEIEPQNRPYVDGQRLSGRFDDTNKILAYLLGSDVISASMQG